MYKLAPLLSKYRVLGLIGKGRLRSVFCAARQETGLLVAIKEFDLKKSSSKKFLREIRFLLSLQHPNIVRFQALEYTHNARYLVMDYCEGGTLRGFMHSQEQLTLVQSLKLIADVLTALEHAHSRGVVHCDIKPENILLTLDRQGWRARISDFGVARQSEEMYSEHLGGTGSPAYMAPERFYGEYSPASDLYAVGVLLFELVVGQRPFSGIPGRLMSAHLNETIKIPNTVPFLVQQIISTALQKLPSNRFASASEMLKSVRLAAEVESSVKRDTPALVFKIQNALLAFPAVSIQLQTLSAPIVSLVVASEQVHLASKTEIHSSTFKNDTLTGEILHQSLLQLKEPVEALLIRPQGCFALTKKCLHNSNIYSIYCLPASSSNNSDHSPDYKLMSLECVNLSIAIALEGNWLAIAKSAITMSGLKRTTFQIFQLPNLQPVKPPQLIRCPSQMIPLDRRHLVAVFAKAEDLLSLNKASLSQLENYNPQNVSTIFEIFTRRGDFVGSLSLPVPLHLVTRSTQLPYRLLAINQNQPTSAFLIDLKPFKLIEIKLEIAPAFIVATLWGYILANETGKILLLNQEGRRIATFNTPSVPSAIAAFKDYGLLLATWSGGEGGLYRYDLRPLIVNR